MVNLDLITIPSTLMVAILSAPNSLARSAVEVCCKKIRVTKLVLSFIDIKKLSHWAEIGKTASEHGTGCRLSICNLQPSQGTQYMG